METIWTSLVPVDQSYLSGALAWSVLVIVAFYVGRLCVHRYAARDRRRLPPGPWGLPVLGYLPFLRRDAAFVSLSDLVRRYGTVYRLRLGCVPTVVVADPHLIRDAFRRKIFCGRPPLYVTNGILEGYGLISAEGDRWREQRRFVATCLRDFGAGHVAKLTRARLEDRIIQEVDAFLMKIRETSGQPFDIHHVLRKTVANLTTSLIFGKRFRDDDPDFVRELDLADRGSEMVDIAGVLNFLPILRFLPRFRCFMNDIWACKAKHHTFLRDIVEEHRTRVSGGDATHDFINAYLMEMARRRAEGKPSHFTEVQLLHLLSDMFGASLDTLKVTIKWTFLHLMLNVDVQRKAQEELDSVIGRSRDPNLDDYAACPYTVALVYEAQRLANVVPLGAPHGTTEDATLGEYFIPKGTMVIPLLWAVHRHPVLWPDPERFRPERFLDGSGAVYKPDYFLPFSTGRRMCVGEELAKMTLFLVVAKTLHRFTFDLPHGEPLPDLTPVSGFIISPRPYRICATIRE